MIAVNAINSGQDYNKKSIFIRNYFLLSPSIYIPCYVSATKSSFQLKNYPYQKAKINFNVKSNLKIQNLLVREIETNEPGWERCAIALTRARTRHIKNKGVVSRTPEILYGILPNLFLVHSFSTLPITIFIITLMIHSVTLCSTFCLIFFFQIINNFQFSCNCRQLNTLNHSLQVTLQNNVSFAYNVARNTTNVTLNIDSLKPIFPKPVFNTLLRDATY